MTTHSVLRLFIILAFMSAILFLHQMATLDRLERQPAFEVVHFQRTAFNKEQVDRYERSFQRAVGAYHEAAKVDHNTGIIRKIADFIFNFPLSPITWALKALDITVEQATNPEEEVKGIIAAGSTALSQERDTIKAAVQEADAMEQVYTQNSLQAKAIITQEQQQAISHARSLRNIALLLFLFSIGSAVFAKPTRMNVAQADWIPAEQPAALKHALLLSGLGGLLSSVPAWGGVFSQLLFPSLCIGYFIIRRQLPKYTGDWKKVAAGGVGFGLLVSVALLIPYALAEKPITFAVSGFLFGLFIATAIEYASLPLTTRQFFLVAFIFGMARLAAYLSAESAGAELTVLEGIAAIFAVFWVIQVHASWVKSIRFDVLLVWFFVYSTVAFVLGNYFQAGFPLLLGSYFTTAISGGGLLAYYLSQVRTEKELLPGIQQDLTGKALLQSPQEA